MFRRHCTDQQLISFRDETLSFWMRWWVASHLDDCWTCFSRARELNEVEEKLASAWRDSGPVPSMDAEAARTRFVDWATAQQSTELAPARGRRWIASPQWKAAFSMGIAAALLIGSVTVWRLERKNVAPPPAASERKPVIVARVLPPPNIGLPSTRAPLADRETFVPEPPAPEPPPPPTVRGPSEEQLLQAEVEAWWVLHRLGACRGEPIEAGPAAGHVRIAGVAPSAARRDELQKLLLESPGHEWMRIELLSAEDLMQRAVPILPNGRHDSAPSSPGDHVAMMRASIAALRLAYPSEDEVQASRRLIDLSRSSIHNVEEAMAEAWAIRRLRERFAKADAQLSAHSRTLIETMLRDHFVALKTDLTTLSRMLQPILGNMALVSPRAGGQSTDLFAAVDRVRVLVEAGFAGDARSLGTPGEIAGELQYLNERLMETLADPNDLVANSLAASKRSPQ